MLKRGLLVAGLLALGACSQTPGLPAERVGLSSQRLGTAADDRIADVAVDRKLGAVYAIGSTEGSLDGPNKGLSDVFLRRYNRSGGVVWKRQMGTSYYDSGRAVDVDRNGYLYAGYDSRLEGGAVGKLEKLRGDGSIIWSRTIRISNNASDVTDLSLDPNGNVYVVGSWGDTGENLFLRKYSSAGLLLWTRRVEGSGLGYVPSVAADVSGHVYVGALMIDDSFIVSDIRKYSPSGALLFAKTVSDGAKDFELNGLGVRGDTLYLTGQLYTNWSGEAETPFTSDALVANLSLNGTERWRKVFGTSKHDGANDVAIDSEGGVYLTGFTQANLGGVYLGGSDIFLRKYDSSGRARWTKQIGSAGEDQGYAVEAYRPNELYLGGEVGGALISTTHRGGQDGFLRRTDGQGNRIWTDQ